MAVRAPPDGHSPPDLVPGTDERGPGPMAINQPPCAVPILDAGAFGLVGFKSQGQEAGRVLCCLINSRALNPAIPGGQAL